MFEEYIVKKNNLKKESTGANVYIAIIPGTKKKLRGSQELKDYILFYSSVECSKRVAAGIAIMIPLNRDYILDNFYCSRI
jgi:hypothetical protein